MNPMLHNFLGLPVTYEARQKVSPQPWKEGNIH